MSVAAATEQKPLRHPIVRCRWNSCINEAVGGATSREADPEWVLPLCGSHLYGLSFSLWSARKESA